MENKIKYLEMIQSVISKMAGNSFMLKGWAVTLVAGLFALSSKEASKFFFFITYIPIISFWGLDAYYLQQERLYRSLYNTIREKDDFSVDFSMEATLKKFSSEKNTWCNCLLSRTEIWFYLPLAVTCAIVIIMCDA